MYLLHSLSLSLPQTISLSLYHSYRNSIDERLSVIFCFFWLIAQWMTCSFPSKWSEAWCSGTGWSGVPAEDSAVLTADRWCGSLGLAHTRGCWAWILLWVYECIFQCCCCNMPPCLSAHELVGTGDNESILCILMHLANQQCLRW